MKNFVLGIFTAAALTLGSAQAALIDRGGGMIYDTDLSITWLQDANLAKTSGYDADGRMSWVAANQWAANLIYGGYADWRLASATDTGAPGCNFSFSGTDCGFGAAGSELAHMFNVNLGLKGYYSSTGTYQSDWGIFGNGSYNSVGLPFYDQKDLGPIHNLQSFVYWTDTAYTLAPTTWAFYFSMGDGDQRINEQYIEFNAWAVRDGDVATVPEPSSLILLGLALAGLGASSRRQKKA